MRTRKPPRTRYIHYAQYDNSREAQLLLETFDGFGVFPFAICSKKLRTSADFTTDRRKPDCPECLELIGMISE